MSASLSTRTPADTFAQLLRLITISDELATMTTGTGTDTSLQVSTVAINALGTLTRQGINVLVETLARNALFLGTSGNVADALQLTKNTFPAMASTGDAQAFAVSDIALALLACTTKAAMLAYLGASAAPDAVLTRVVLAGIGTTPLAQGGARSTIIPITVGPGAGVYTATVTLDPSTGIVGNRVTIPIILPGAAGYTLSIQDGAGNELDNFVSVATATTASFAGYFDGAAWQSLNQSQIRTP